MTEQQERDAEVRACVALQTVMAIGVRIADRRISLGMTVEEAARIIGVSTEEVNEIESKTGQQSLENVAMLAAACGMRISVWEMTDTGDGK